MTAAELLAEHIVPLWLDPDQTTGSPLVDASTALGKRHLKADGERLTQFNTGAIVVRDTQVLALTDCQPRQRSARLVLGAPVRSRATVIEDIRRNGPPLLAVIFKKGAFDIHRWACSTADEVVLNGLAGPEETAAMEDVALLRGLPGHPRDWRRLARLCADALMDLSSASLFHEQATKLSGSLRMNRNRVLTIVHHLRHASDLTFDLATIQNCEDGAAAA